MPLVRKAVTLSFCQTARSSLRTIANFVSNTKMFLPDVHEGPWRTI